MKITIQQLADLVLERFKRTDLTVEYSGWKPGDIRYFEIDNSKIKNLGMNFSWGFEDGVDETIKWMKDNK
ncbi:hypothetical protein [Geomicrobium sp. JCM 19055]|uniref:hypothetical protein n=1 Tax=Geomicrobium sp. JCM 19055 TaxID=1460649 RepID=UPI0006950C0A|nr:hypothetical protein [Geomicrobium sp. JCM 19055]